MQMPQDQLVSFIKRFVDPHHKSLVIFQAHIFVIIAVKSKVRTVFASRKGAQEVGSRVRFYPGLGCYDHGYFKSDGMKPAHQVILFLKYTNSFLILISFIVVL